MDHPQVITTLDTLLPEVIRTKDPHQVFLKAANERRWSPAQLEHVGQTFNTLKTVNYLDKTAGEERRGGSFQLLDVPALVDDYVTAELPVTGQTSWGALDSEWLDKQAMEKAASDADAESDWFDSADSMTKGAADECHVPHVANIMCNGEPMSSFDDPERESVFALEAQEREKQAAMNVIKHNSMLLEDYAMDEDVKANEAFRKISSYGAALPEVMQDMKVHLGEDFDKVAAALESYGERYGFEMDLNPPDEDLRRIVEDRHNAEPFFKMALDAVENLETVRYMLDDLEKSASVVYATNPVDAETRRRTGPSGKDVKEQKDKTRKDKPGGKSTGDDQKRTDKPEGKATGKEEKRKEEPKGKEPSNEKLEKEAPRVGGGQEEQLPNIGKGLAAGAETLASVPGRMATAGREAVTDHSKGMGELIDAVRPLKHDRQIAVDDAVSEAQEKATIQSLILTDPILSKEDPQEVLNLYESLRAADPSMAADPNTLKMALREAISYEGIPQHALKDMTERRERAAKAEQVEQEVARSKYAL